MVWKWNMWTWRRIVEPLDPEPPKLFGHGFNEDSDLPITQFLPKMEVISPLKTGHLKTQKKGHSGRTISSFFPLKPFNVGLPSLKVHPPFLNHQKINWKWSWKRQFGRVSNLKMWNIGRFDGQPLPCLISKNNHIEALYCGKRCIIRHVEVSNKYMHMFFHGFSTDRHAYMPWKMTLCWLLARMRWISRWSFCICVCVWRVWRKVACPQHTVHCLSLKDTLSPKWFLVVTFSRNPVSTDPSDRVPGSIGCHHRNCPGFVGPYLKSITEWWEGSGSMGRILGGSPQKNPPRGGSRVFGSIVS